MAEKEADIVIKVDLPAPLSPTSDKISPGQTLNEASVSASIFPNDLEIL